MAFFLMYSSFTIIKGSFTGGGHAEFENSRKEIQIFNGVIEIGQVTLQVIFLEYFRQKVSAPG